MFPSSHPLLLLMDRLSLVMWNTINSEEHTHTHEEQNVLIFDAFREEEKLYTTL